MALIHLHEEYKNVINCKAKVKLSHYHHAGDKGERKYSSYSFLTLALDGGEWSASRPSHTLPLGKDPPGTHWIGGWVGLRAGLDTEEKSFASARDRAPVVQSIVRHYTD